MTDVTMAPVLSLGAAELDPLHDPGKRPAFGFEQQTDVVRYQDASKHAKSITLAIMLHAFQVRDAVVVIMKNSLLLIATDNHMVERFVDSTLGLRAMERKLVGDKRLGQNAGPTTYRFRP